MEAFLDPIFLSRIQFAFVVSFHIIFPSLTIGLASWLFVLEVLWVKTKHPVYKEIYQHWAKIFAISFGMGVVSGLVMSYQFGTNWAEFSHKAGNVIGPLLAFEVLTAFFLEASFLGIMLFGWNKVSKRMHLISTGIVAFGTVVSAFWILSVNSWMQTPTGFEIRDGIFFPTSWMEIIFNPSFMPRLFHMVLAAYLTTAFFVAGVAAWYLFKKKHLPHAKIMFAMGMIMAVLVTPIQIIVGHEHGANSLEYQPAKVAAIEGIWETESGAALNLFGIPNEQNETTDYAIQIPKGASLILTGDSNAEILGLKEWSEKERPPVAPVFFGFRIMVGIGVLMLFTGIVSIILYKRKTLFKNATFLKWCMLMAPSGFIAILAGWMVTEVGRQPYTIYGQLLTRESASNISHQAVSLSLACFILTYTIIFGAGIYYLFKVIRQGPKVNEPGTYGDHGMVPHSIKLKDIFPKG